MEKISWTDRVRNEELLQRVKGERNILRSLNRRTANRIGHILRRNFLLGHVTEGNKRGKDICEEKRGRRPKKLLE
jgi:hypothetical protein